MKKVTVSAPGKLMVLGEHAVVYNRPCIVTAVDSRIKVTVEQRKDRIVEILAQQINNKPFRRPIYELNNGRDEEIPKEVKFVCKAVESFIKDNTIDGGLTITTESDFSHRYGFGSSSAVTVATLKGLSELYSIGYTERQIFDLAYEVTLDIQGVGSGFDIAAAVYGGTLYFVTGGKRIEKITDKKLPLVVGYTGVKADTPTLVRQVAELKKEKPDLVENIFKNIEELVKMGREYIKEEKWKYLGDLFKVNQKTLYELGVSTTKLDVMCKEAESNGAYGAKLSGAGGGDCMVALVSKEKQKRVEKAIESVGGKIIPVTTSAEGVRIEK